MIANLKELLENESAIIFKCKAGSTAYGTNNELSDVDIKGIFVHPCSYYLNLELPPGQVSDDRNDISYYSLHRFAQLASCANPNFIELLFMPSDCVLKSTKFFGALLNEKDLFISKEAYQSHINYGLSQIKRSKGRNKWINNPQPKEKPQKETYCWYIPSELESPSPYRPIRLSETMVDLRRCHVASLEHADQVYRLYEIGKSARGVFRDEQLVCESISIEDEDKCIGLLIYNQRQFEKDLNEFKNYHHWLENRNPSRWNQDEEKQLDYDTKNMMHTFRLLMSGKSILEFGHPLVRFEGEALKLLMNIRAGVFTYEELMDMSEKSVKELELVYHNCDLPEKADVKKIEELVYEISKNWESDNAGNF